MQSDESPKWVYESTPKLYYAGVAAGISGILYICYFYYFGQLSTIDAVKNAAYPLIAGLPLIGTGLAGALTSILGILLVCVYCLVFLLGCLIVPFMVSPAPREQADGWVFATSVKIPHEPWRTLVIDLPDDDKFILPDVLAFEVLLGTPVDLSSPSLLADRTVTQEPIYPNYDEDDSQTMAQLGREELFDPQLWTGEGIRSTFDERVAPPSYDLAPLGYDALRIDRRAFEQVLDVARRVPLENFELPPPDATLAEHGIALDDRRFVQMKDARMQLDALRHLLLRCEQNVRFEKE